MEILTALGMGTLLAAIGATICLSSIQQRHDQHVPQLYAIWPLLASIATHGTLATIKMRIGKRFRKRGHDRRRLARSG